MLFADPMPGTSFYRIIRYVKVDVHLPSRFRSTISNAQVSLQYKEYAQTEGDAVD